MAYGQRHAAHQLGYSTLSRVSVGMGDRSWHLTNYSWPTQPGHPLEGRRNNTGHARKDTASSEYSRLRDIRQLVDLIANIFGIQQDIVKWKTALQTEISLAKGNKKAVLSQR